MSPQESVLLHGIFVCDSERERHCLQEVCVSWVCADGQARRVAPLNDEVWSLMVPCTVSAKAFLSNLLGFRMFLPTNHVHFLFQIFSFTRNLRGIYVVNPPQLHFIYLLFHWVVHCCFIVTCQHPAGALKFSRTAVILMQVRVQNT